jgi:hypothetical protein
MLAVVIGLRLFRFTWNNDIRANSSRQLTVGHWLTLINFEKDFHPDFWRGGSRAYAANMQKILIQG